MYRRKLAEKMAEKINDKMQEKLSEVAVSRDVGSNEVSVETIEKVLERNPQLAMSAEARKVQDTLNRAKRRPGSNSNQIVKQAFLKHLAQEENAGHLIKNENDRYVMTDDYLGFGVPEVDRLVAKTCGCTK